MTNCVFIDYFVRRLRQLNQGMCKKITYIRMHKFMTQKRKSLFIPIEVQLITNSGVILYISEINSTSNSLKKKKKEPQERGKERKRECERKGKRDGKEKEREKRREEERLKKKEKEKKEEKEGRGENRKSDTKNVPPSPYAFPNTKLGNNITPTKGKLGKNITPISRGQPKPNVGPKSLGGSPAKKTKP